MPSSRFRPSLSRLKTLAWAAICAVALVLRVVTTTWPTAFFDSSAFKALSANDHSGEKSDDKLVQYKRGQKCETALGSLSTRSPGG